MLAKKIAKSASDLKASDIRVLDLTGLSSFTDFFVVCSGTSNRHVQSVADKVVEDQKKAGNSPFGVEGYEKCEWVLVDFGNVVAHVFYPEARTFYNIEKLWGDALQLQIKGVTG
jgi:ribosome-associated protein